jgi:hypothetical protein
VVVAANLFHPGTPDHEIMQSAIDDIGDEVGFPNRALAKSF